MRVVQYGYIETTKTDGDMAIVEKKNVTNFDPVSITVEYMDIKRVKDENEALAIMLKLLDDQKAGKVFDIGMQCKRDNKTGTLRVERKWHVRNL